MLDRLGLRRLTLLWRYYQVGVLNTLFGFGLYAGLVRLGLNLYGAQIVSHLIGMAFNYFTYSRHVFSGAAPAKARYIAAYGFNYIISLGALAIAHRFVASPYGAGAIAVLAASFINYFVLRHLVFKERAA